MKMHEWRIIVNIGEQVKYSPVATNCLMGDIEYIVS